MRTIQEYNTPGEYLIKLRYDRVGEEKEWRGVVRAEREGEYKLMVIAEHTARNTKGKVVLRAIAKNGARVNLAGMIKIHKKAQGTDSFLELRVLLLDDKSSAVVDPQLEIEANQVKAGHAGSVTKLEEEQVQYLMSRGLARKQAEKQIIEGWLGLSV